MALSDFAGSLFFVRQMDDADDSHFDREDDGQAAGNTAQALAAGDPTAEDESEKQKLKAAVHFFVSKICENEAKKMNMRISKMSMAVFSEVLVGFAEGLAKDIELFARHAKRSTIKPEDVLLFARKSKELSAKLTQMNSELQTAAESRKRGRKRKEKSECTETTTNSTTVITKGVDQSAPPQTEDSIHYHCNDNDNDNNNNDDDFEQPKFKKAKLNFLKNDSLQIHSEM
jgi:centromere protein S